MAADGGEEVLAARVGEATGARLADVRAEASRFRLKKGRRWPKDWVSPNPFLFFNRNLAFERGLTT